MKAPLLRAPWVRLWLLSLFALGLCRPTQGQTLERGFRTPPPTVQPYAFWQWMNGHITAEQITRDLEAMKQVGIGGFMIWNTSEGTPPGPVPFMSPAWWKLLDHAMSDAERLGLKMGMFNCGGWATTAGPWITPDRAMQEVVWTEKRVTGPTDFDGALETPVPALGIDRDMAADAEANRRYYVPREQVRGYYRDIVLWAIPTPKGPRSAQPFQLKDWKAKAAYSKLMDYTPDQRTAPPEDCIDPDSMVNLSAHLDRDGHLQWAVPPGEWTLLRIGYQPTGRSNHPAPEGGKGLEVDKLTAAAIDFQWKHSVAKMIETAGPRLTSTFFNVHLDSYEAGHQNWSASFAEDFRSRRGYDLTRYLPIVTGRIVKDAQTSERFLWDFRKTISDLMVENYFGRFQALCAENHLQLSIEPYGLYGNADDFAAAGKADIPMGEFWAQTPAKYHHASTKVAASTAHEYGRPIVGDEAFTGEPTKIFEDHPYALKAQGDYFFCQGATRLSFHNFVHNPYAPAPGFALGSFGSRIDPKNTWWPYAGPWMEYLARCQYLLRQGQFVADMIYYAGEDAPQAAKPREKLLPQPPDGYDYDFANREILDWLKVADGRVVLPSGMSYRVLVLPADNWMSWPVLQRIEALVAAGATVVGPKPVRIPGIAVGQEEAQLRRLANKMWGACDGRTTTEVAYGKGRIYWGRPLAPVMTAVSLAPDFTFAVQGERPFGKTQYAGNGIEYIHRQTTDGDIYFVSNQHYEPKTIAATFRSGGRLPELWDAATGQTVQTGRFQATSDGRTTVTLDLDPAGSVFVIFRHPAAGESGIAVAASPQPTGYTLDRDGDRLLLHSRNAGQYAFQMAHGPTIKVDVAAPGPIALAGPWRVDFPPGWDTPPEITLPKLISWTEDTRFGVKHYSGTATYHTAFDLPADYLQPARRALLNLGNVQVVARLKVNGHDLGVLWKAPYEADVTAAVHSGHNDIEVQVANLWINRILGDQYFPDDVEWTTQTGTRMPGEGLAKVPDWVVQNTPRPSPQRKTFTAWLWPHLQKDKKALEPSGLLGPVQLLTETIAEVKASN